MKREKERKRKERVKERERRKGGYIRERARPLGVALSRHEALGSPLM